MLVPFEVSICACDGIHERPQNKTGRKKHEPDLMISGAKNTTPLINLHTLRDHY